MIEERIIELKNIAVIKLSKVKSYTALTELEKIPFRIMQAEILALEEYLKGQDLDNWLSKCVESEYYCAAEGIKKVKEWLKLNAVSV